MRHVTPKTLLRSAASPALVALIDAYRAAQAEHNEARAAWRPFLDAQQAADAAGPTDTDRYAAMERVPAPDILVVPKRPFVGKDCVKLTYHRADGTADEVDLTEDPNWVLNTLDLVQKHYAGNEEKLDTATAALSDWWKARRKAADLLATPEMIQAKKVAEAAFAPVRRACELREAAERALVTFEPPTPEDRLLLFTVLLEEAGVDLNRKGLVPRGAIDLDEPVLAARLLNVALEGLRAAGSLDVACTPMDTADWDAAVAEVRRHYETTDEAFSSDALSSAVTRLLTLTPPDLQGFRFLFEVVMTETQGLGVRAAAAEEGSARPLTGDLLLDSCGWPTLQPCVFLEPGKGLQAGLVHLRRALDTMTGSSSAAWDEPVEREPLANLSLIAAE